MNTKWLGLWKQGEKSLYVGQVIKKADIPAYTRIVLKYNKFYEKDGNRPRFVFCFADSKGYESMCIPVEIEEEEDSGYGLEFYKELQGLTEYIGYRCESCKEKLNIDSPDEYRFCPHCGVRFNGDVRKLHGYISMSGF